MAKTDEKKYVTCLLRKPIISTGKRTKRESEGSILITQEKKQKKKKAKQQR